MIIVKMQPKHIESIAALEKQCFSAPWSEKSLLEEVENLSAVFLVAEEKGEILGYAGMHAVCGEGYIDNIAVFPVHRRKGVAKALINELASQTEEFITLEVRESNLSAINLYLSMGFKTEGIRKNFYMDPNENALILTKNNLSER